MHLYFERNINAKCDCAILSLTWMGKVPEELPEDDGWKLNRHNYYQEGWLATGNVRGIVGVTFTTSHSKKSTDTPLRTNYNLRGHRSEVILVKWNEPYQKLASCDSSGIIFVWIKYEGRWSIELINDRNTPVTHFSWSHDGRMALICYQDGFVLVGSVAGQRYWSSMLNIEATITCGIWTPDDQQVYFGTSSGQIIVMDVHGAMVSQVQLGNDIGITNMAWSCEKFKMDESDEGESVNSINDDRSYILAVSFNNGYIFLMKSFDDVSPVQIHTGLYGPMRFEWSNSRELLAVAGTIQQSISPIKNIGSNDGKNSVDYTNVIKFYSSAGVLLYSSVIPDTQSPVTAMTWGHNDKRLFIATGCNVHIACVLRNIASLQHICRLKIYTQLKAEYQTALLPLPAKLKSLISNLFVQTIRCSVPETFALREFVSRPPPGNVRLHCTMIRHSEDVGVGSAGCYTLYLEYLGGLVPLLKGKRTSKIRPEFVIFDPQLGDSSELLKTNGSSHYIASDTSDTEREDGCGSPRVQRRKRRRNKSQSYSERANTPSSQDKDQNELLYMDTLPENSRLVEVTSNIWGTKFKIHGLASSVPDNLGQVTYKTSLLHLQPRQMTLVMTELRDDCPPEPDPNFNPNLFSEDEEETPFEPEYSRLRSSIQTDIAPPIAPMIPKSHFTMSGNIARFAQNYHISSSHSQQLNGENIQKSHLEHHSFGCEANVGININHSQHFQKSESHDDEYPYVDLSSMTSFCEALKASTPSPNVKNYIDGYPFPQIISTSNGIATAGSSSYNAVYSTITQYSRNNITSSGSSNQTWHVMSPLVCEGTVSALQSPKNAVAPSEVVIDRGTTSQTLMSTAGPTDYTGSIQRVKSSLSDQSQNFAVNMNLNLPAKELNCVELRSKVIKRLDLEGNNRLHQVISGVSNDKQITANCDTISVSSNTISLHNISPQTKGTCNMNVINIEKSKEKPVINKQSPSVHIGSTNKSVCKTEDMLYIDEETNSEHPTTGKGVKRIPTSMSIALCTPACFADSMVRSCSVGYLDLVDAQVIPSELAFAMLRKEAPKRLVLVNRKKQRKQREKSHHNNQQSGSSKNLNLKTTNLKQCGKSRSLDSSEIFPATSQSNSTVQLLPSTSEHIARSNKSHNDSIHLQNKRENVSAVCMKTNISNNTSLSLPEKVNSKNGRKSPNIENIPLTFYNNDSSETECESNGEKNPGSIILMSGMSSLNSEFDAKTNLGKSNISKDGTSSVMNGLTGFDFLRLKKRDFYDSHSLPSPSPRPSPRLPHSSPASPAPSKKSAKRNQSSSPIRKHLLNSPLLSRRQRRTKLIESSDDEVVFSGDELFDGKNYKDLESFQKAQLKQKLKRGKCKGDITEGYCTSYTTQHRREFIMHNKAPMWNENSQVYQLDFGGRVTQESAKNFQIEFRGKQVMQFGRIDGNAYTLDFQYPFSALQAFAVALANVTQRLK